MAKHDYQQRVSEAVYEAVISASRSPDGKGVDVDVTQAVAAMAHAMSVFIISTAALLHETNNELLAAEIEGMGERVADTLTEMARRAREGTLVPKDREKPSLKLV
jgi:hypothetical protein